MKVTSELLATWGACKDGRDWFSENFPEGAAYSEIQVRLDEQKNRNYSDWIANKFVEKFEESNEFIRAFNDYLTSIKVEMDANSLIDGVVEDSENKAIICSDGYYAKIGSSGYYAKIGSSGYYAKIGSSGDYAKIGSSGYYAKIGSSGDSAQIGSSGYYAKIGSSGDYAKIGSSGDYAKIGSSGDSAQIKATGKESRSSALGIESCASSGEGGFIALTYKDTGGRFRLAVGYEGEEIEVGKMYKVSENGEFIVVE